MNKQYKRGYRAELRCRHQLEEYGYLVVRSAGSKTSFDLIGIRAKDVIGVQVKTGERINARKCEEEVKKLKDIPSPENMRKELWVWTEKTGFQVFTEIKKINDGLEENTTGGGVDQ